MPFFRPEKFLLSKINFFVIFAIYRPCTFAEMPFWVSTKQIFGHFWQKSKRNPLRFCRFFCQKLWVAKFDIFVIFAVYRLCTFEEILFWILQRLEKDMVSRKVIFSKSQSRVNALASYGALTLGRKGRKISKSQIDRTRKVRRSDT